MFGILDGFLYRLLLCNLARYVTTSLQLFTAQTETTQIIDSVNNNKSKKRHAQYSLILKFSILQIRSYSSDPSIY